MGIEDITAGGRKTSSHDELKPALAYVYIGAGAALPDVPARDLTADEIGDLVDYLVALSAQAHAAALDRLPKDRRAAFEAERPADTPASIRKSLIDSGLYKKAGT